MTDSSTRNRSIEAGLATLLIIQTIMLLSLYSQTPPHPPSAIPPFGIAPFIAVSLSAAVSAMILGTVHGRAGWWMATAAVIMAMVSFGPHKYFDPQFKLVWPAVIAAQIAAMAILAGLYRSIRE